MDEAKRKLLIDIFESQFSVVGVELYSSATKFKAWLDANYRFVEVSQSRERLDAFLAACPLEELESFDQLVQMIGAIGGITAQFVDQAIAQAARNAPKAPSGRKTISIELKRQIIDRVGSLHNSGVQLSAAHTRAALHFSLGKRTVQRVWSQRKDIAEQPFVSMDDVLSFLRRAAK